MSFWKSVNDKIHDVMRGIKKRGNDSGRSVEDEQEQVPLQSGNLDREISNSSAIERATDYKKVSHSSSVKSLMRHINKYEAAMNRMRIPEQRSGQNGDQEFLNELAQVNGTVFTYMQEMYNYLIRKAQGYTQKGKMYTGIMSACITEATRIRTQMDWVNKIQENCYYAVRRGGRVPYGESYTDLLRSVNYFQETDYTDRTVLGQGGINTVYTVEDTERNQERVLKEGHMDMEITNISESSVYERIRKEKAVTGKKYTMNTAHRDVAVSMIDKLFNLNAVVDTSLARTKGGNQASLMDKAAGKEVTRTVAYMGDSEMRRAGLLRQIRANAIFLERGLEYKFSDKEREEKEKWQKAQGTQIVDINSAKFLESTYNLAALDVIVGHVDRHAGNMMMTADGVKGIDNDSAFSLRKTGQILGKETKDMTNEEFRLVSHEKNENGESVEVMNAQGQAALFLDKAFPKVPAMFRDKILGVSLAAVAGVLRGLLEKDEIEACVNRVDELQKYMKNLPDDKIVDSFEEIDRNGYSTEEKRNAIGTTYTNIMSHIRGSGGVAAFEECVSDDEVRDLRSFTEVKTIRNYVKRMRGEGDSIKIYWIAYYLMKELEREISSGEFDMYTALMDGTMVGLLARAEAMESNREKEKS